MYLDRFLWIFIIMYFMYIKSPRAFLRGQSLSRLSRLRNPIGECACLPASPARLSESAGILILAISRATYSFLASFTRIAQILLTMLLFLFDLFDVDSVKHLSTVRVIFLMDIETQKNGLINNLFSHTVLLRVANLSQ